MQIGDKVRMLHGSEQGIIVKILPQNLCEVEIEDGFRIPVLKSELVKINSQEADFFEDEKPRFSTKPEKFDKQLATESSNTLAIAVSPYNDKIHELHLINTTAFDITYNITEERSAALSPVMIGTLAAGKSVKFNEWDIRHSDNWPVIVLQVSWFSKATFAFKAPEVFNFSLKPKLLLKEAGFVKVINKKGHFFDLKEKASVKIDATALKERLMGGTSNEQSAKPSAFTGHSIDLHIENLDANHENIPKNEILAIQINAFELFIDQAIAAGHDEVTIIHGLGNGVLRNHVHKYLGQHPHIKFFKDAQKEKFGYGATLAKIK